MKSNTHSGSGFLDGLTDDLQKEKQKETPRTSSARTSREVHPKGSYDFSKELREKVQSDSSWKNKREEEKHFSQFGVSSSRLSHSSYRGSSERSASGSSPSSRSSQTFSEGASISSEKNISLGSGSKEGPSAKEASAVASRSGLRKTEKAARIMLSRRSQHQRLLAFAFTAVVLVLMVLHLVSPDRTYSEAENRKLAQLPKWSWESTADGSFFSAMDSYLADQFFARDSWMSLKLREDTLLGRKEAGGVYLGEEGYLLSQPVVPNETAILRTARAINAFASQNPQIPMVVMTAPGSAAVQSQYLPKNAPIRNQEEDIRLLYDQLSASIRLVDVTNALVGHAGEYIYYKTDHHWTSLGAFYAFCAAAPKMGISDALTEKEDYAVYSVAADFQGTLSSKSGSHPSCDVVDIYIPKDSSVSYYVNYVDSGIKSRSFFQSAALESKDKYTVFFGGNHPLMTIKTTADNGRALLIFKDSYANSFIPFLYPYYEDIVVIDPRYYYDSLSGLMGNYGITDVLFLYSADTLLVDTALADVLGAE